MFKKIWRQKEVTEGARKILICRNDQDLAECRQKIRDLGGEVVKELPLVHGLVCILPDVTLTAKLEASAKIKRVEDDIRFHTSCLDFFLSKKSRPSAKPQEMDWGVKRIGAPEAWPVSKGAQVKVAVIDTGIQLGHPDLKDRIDKGFNTITLTKNANDDNGHGTHVAGIIAASDNDFGVVGVSPEVVLYPVKVLDSNGSGSLSDVVAGIQWCIEQGVDIINMSLGASDSSETFAEAVRIAASKGIIIVAAAGNSGPDNTSIDYPAKYPETIAVAASDQNDRIADFSSRGPEVDISAPGVDINSTYLGSKYTILSGTSMATPHVTGTIALLKALHRNYTLADIKSILKRSAHLLPNFSPQHQGVGLVQAGVAVNKYAL
ncbi:MAG: S8 family peptidase [Firmicutes bacterium]|nr:S8 family peptidase [Bacillota bacterium]